MNTAHLFDPSQMKSLERKDLPVVINFSGGKSSALMAITVYKKGDIVLFCDTGREHPKTYKFIDDFEKTEGIPIIRLAYPGSFEGMIEREGNKTVPNRVMRFCTKHLKILTARKYLLSIGIKKCYNLIGFRHDEQRRIVKSKPGWVGYYQRFPLDELKITVDDVNKYWEAKAYTLELPRILGNCDLCFLKGKNAIITILKEFPELAGRWIADEERTGRTYFKDVSYRQLLEMAAKTKSGNINEALAAFDCACTS